jgi:YVTN family beta-propeller protein
VARVFLSYRRGNTNAHAGRLYDRLTDRFGTGEVFMDIDAIEPGADFVEHIREAVSSCDAIVVLIGNDWLGGDEPGNRRLDSPDDFVRLEVATGLERGVRVVPVLVQGVRMPGADDLPPALAALARRNALEVSDLRWNEDVARLVGTLERVLGEDHVSPSRPTARSRRAPLHRHPGIVKLALPVVAALLALGVAAAVLLSGDDGDSGGAPVATATSAGSAREVIDVGTTPTGAALGSGAVWVANAADGTVTRIDVSRRAVVGRPIEVGQNATYIAADENGVWVTYAGKGASGRGGVVRIDPRTNDLVGTPIRTGGFPAGVAVDGESVWVANAGDGTVTRIDAATGRIRGTVRVGGTPIALAVSKGRVWVPNEIDGSVSVIDAASMKMVGAPIFVGREPGGIAAGAGAVWVTNAADDTVSRIDPVRRRVVGKPIRVGRNPGDVAVGAGGVWVANESAGTVTRIDPRANRTVGRAIHVGRSPSGLVAGTRDVWVPNSDDDTVTRIESAA